MAYGRTFLELVNDALRELREEEVATWNETEYSTLVGGWINACKRSAENAWRWSTLRDTFAFTTVPNTTTYAFTNTDQRSQVLDGWNLTTGVQLAGPLPWRGMNAAFYSLNPVTPGSVVGWTNNGINASTGCAQVDLYPTPNAAESLVFTVYAPQLDLTADADVMVVPHRPVVEGAIARARYERGDDSGISFVDQQVFMERSLADHIALDAHKHPEDIMWEAE